PDRCRGERGPRAGAAVRARRPPGDRADRGRPRAPHRRPPAAPARRSHPHLGVRAVGGEGVRPRPAARRAHWRPGHPRPGAGTAAAGPRLGASAPAARGRAAVDRRRGRPGRRRRGLRAAARRADRGAGPARDRGPRAQRDERVGARARRDRRGGPSAARGLGGGARCPLPVRRAAGHPHHRLHPHRRRGRTGRAGRRDGARTARGGGPDVRLARPGPGPRQGAYRGRRGLTWVSAAPARTITAPTGTDQVSRSPRMVTPAAAAMTGMKYVTIWPVVGPTSATRPYWTSIARPVPSVPSAATASSGTTAKSSGADVNSGVTTASCTVARRSCPPVSDRWEWGLPARVR